MIQFRGRKRPPERFILVADEFRRRPPRAELPQDRLAGVVVRDGAANSHAAIMVRALGIPTVMYADIQPSVKHAVRWWWMAIAVNYWSILNPCLFRNISGSLVKR